ncbi:hypothetical protein FRC02_011223 [Tulasnella sp. 418]|nr:hypothetical protein FRC02_011223 [Tulasnella sp. 418]
MPPLVLLVTLFHAAVNRSKPKPNTLGQRHFDDMADEELGQASSPASPPKDVQSPSLVSPSFKGCDTRCQEDVANSDEADVVKGGIVCDDGDGKERKGNDQGDSNASLSMRRQSSSAYSMDSIASSEDQSRDNRRHRRLPRWKPFSTQPPPPDQSDLLRKIRHFIWQHDPDAGNGEFVPNYRYLPILSGILSPFAILLEIPGLTERWYIRTEGHKTVETKSNPTILKIGMAASMVFGVLANAALITRFLEKRVKAMTIICMLFLVLHDIINIIAVTVFGVVHRHDDGFTFGEAFWITACSTIASIAATATLGWDLWSTTDFAKSGSGLTRKQRSLIILVMILIAYIALGSLVYAFAMDITFQDGLYFTVVSLETIGFGDIAPNNAGSRVFAIFYNTFGIINLGLVVSTTQATIVEAFENAYRKRRAEVARRHKKGILAATEKVSKDGLNEKKREAARQELGKAGHNLEGHDPIEPKKASYLEVDQMQGRPPELSKELMKEETPSAVPVVVQMQESFQDFTEKILKEEQKEFTTKLIVAWSVFLAFWVVGAAIFTQTEQSWNYGDSLYFCWVSFVTIGYGDLTPKSPAGRAIFVVWALLGVAAMTTLISVLSEAYSTRYKSATRTDSFKRVIESFRRRTDASPEADRRRDRQEGTRVTENVLPKTLSEKSGLHQEQTQKLSERAKVHLKEVLLDVIKHAHAFTDHVRYLDDDPSHHNDPPLSLTALLDELAEAEKMHPRMKEEFLADEDARKALFHMSYERVFQRLLDTAERAVDLLAIKDAGRDVPIVRLEDVAGTEIHMAPALNSVDAPISTLP